MVLQALRSIGGIETHLVLTAAARRTIELETEMSGEISTLLPTFRHRDDDLAAAISSGSFLTDGMLVIPCSMKSASAIAYSMNANLLVRAADVCLKEKRKAGAGDARDAAASRPPSHARPAGRNRCGDPAADSGDVRQPAERATISSRTPSARRSTSSASPTNSSSAGVRRSSRSVDTDD